MMNRCFCNWLDLRIESYKLFYLLTSYLLNYKSSMLNRYCPNTRVLLGNDLCQFLCHPVSTKMYAFLTLPVYLLSRLIDYKYILIQVYKIFERKNCHKFVNNLTTVCYKRTITVYSWAELSKMFIKYLLLSSLLYTSSTRLYCLPVLMIIMQSVFVSSCSISWRGF